MAQKRLWTWLLAAGLAAHAAVAEAAVVRPARTAVFTTDEGSDFSVTPSPSGDRLLLDLQGSLWSLPAAGGVARRLTPDLMEAMRPDWSPDGQRIVAQAYADGMWGLWLLSADGRRRRRLTFGPHDDTWPRWSPDGRAIAFLSNRGGAAGVWLVDPAGGAPRQVAGGLAAPQGLTWTPDGRRLLVADRGRIRAIALEGESEDLNARCAAGAAAGATLSPSGARLAYVCAGPGGGRLMLRDADGEARPVGALDDVFAFPPRWRDEDTLLFTANGKIRSADVASGAVSVVPMRATFRLRRGGYRRKAYDFDDVRPRAVKGIVAPALSPDGQRIVFQALNDLWLREASGEVRPLTRGPAYETDPVWSPDGRSIAYSSDASGLPQLHVLDLATGESRRLTDDARASTAPAWSPDGGRLAYQTEAGATRVLELATGAQAEVAPAMDAPSRPSWSADGRTLAFTVANTGRNRILLVDVASRATRWADVAPNGSVSARGDDGPVWSPDGRWLAVVHRGTLWVLPVAVDGTPAGPVRRLNREATDAPSWSGDGRTLLYLNNGRLRRLDLASRRVETVPLRLTWRPEAATGRRLVHAGRLWDGVSPDVRTHVDILIEGQRIRSITPHAAHDSDVEVIDASNLTVTPGLFEMHNHQQLRAKHLGDRQGRLWLAYGVTSTRSTGDPAYRAKEDQEALAAGVRIGPRHFMTGEMLEGSRPLWSFSRVVEDHAQLRLELGRAQALEYDVLKTYMRLRSDWQAEVARFGHRRLGVSTTSHFLFPGVAHGVDGEEHFVGPTRWSFGFPHLFRGAVYGDVFGALGAARMELTTTNFAGRQSLLDLPGLPHDPRLEALYPPWEKASLARFMGCAAKTGPCDFFLTPDAEQSRLTARDLVRAARAGAQVMVGSDAPLDSLVVSTFQNLHTLQVAGFTPFEALQAATLVPARAQGVAADLGSIEPGKLADLVFVDGRPDADVRDLMRVKAVMKAGRYWPAAALLEPAPSAGSASTPTSDATRASSSSTDRSS